MHRFFAALVCFACAVTAQAQPAGKPAPAAPGGRPGASSKTRPAEPDAALKSAIAAHAKAIATGDYQAAAAFWTPDGDYADPSGKFTAARAALEREAKAGAGTAAGKAIPRTTLTTGSVRMVTPEMAIEDGSAELGAGSSGKPAVKGTYTAVWIRQQGKWLISSMREHGMSAAAAEAPATLDDLSCFVGHWQAERGGNTVSVDCHWAPGKRFLLRDITVTQKDGTSQQINQRIGLVASTGTIRSWSFDVEGGTSEGNWARKGDDWVVALHGVRDDGAVTSGRATYSNISSDQYDFETTDASVDDQKQPAVQLQFRRQAAAPPSATGAANDSATPKSTAAPPTSDEQAARDAILKSPAFRDTVYAFRDWIAGQPYTPDELAKLKAEFQEKVETFSAPQLQQLLASSQRKLEILTSPASEEARQWVASQMALLTRPPADDIAIVRPDIFQLSAAELQQQVLGVQTRRADIARSRAAFNKANTRNLQAIDNMVAEQNRAREERINRPSTGLPYGSAMAGSVRQYDYKPQTANLGLWVW